MGRLVYVSNPKHRVRKRGRVSAEPSNGQEVLDRSVRITEHSPRRIGVDPVNKEIVVFMQHLPDVFHGFVVEWRNLQARAQTTLLDLGLVTRRGRIRMNK